MNNNDISLFQKIVFVNNVDNEYDAYKLSKDYPFAVILTPLTQEGIENGIKTKKDNETNTYIPDNINKSPGSGNIWLGGDRLTKFINVKKGKNSISMDTYSIVLDFDSASGLLSLYRQEKVDDYEVSVLFYKDSNNEFKLYTNKTAITTMMNTDYNSGLPAIDFDNANVSNNNKILDRTTLNEILDRCEEITKDADDKHSWSIDNIDSIDNTFYLVIRYEIKGNDNNISEQSFDLNTSYDTYEIIDNSKKLNNYFGVAVNNVFNGDFFILDNNYDGAADFQHIDDIDSLTMTLSKYYKNRNNDQYIIYRLRVIKNIENNTDPFIFTFNTLTDFNQYNDMFTVNRELTYINPDLNNIQLLKTSNDTNSSLDENNIFIMPNESMTLSLVMSPPYIRKLKLYIGHSDLNGNFVEGLDNGFVITDTDSGPNDDNTNKNIKYNWHINNNVNTNSFSFTIKAPADYIYLNDGNDPTQSSLRLKIVKEELDSNNEINEVTIWDSYDTDNNEDIYTIYQCTYEGLNVNNATWGISRNNVTSGEVLNGLNTNDVKTQWSKRTSYLQADPIIFKEKNILSGDSDLNITLRLIDNPENANPTNNNRNIAYVDNKTDFSDLSGNIDQLPNKIRINTNYIITVPWVFKTYYDQNNSKFNNLLEWKFSYKLAEVTKTINVKADTIKNIFINSGLCFKQDNEIVTEVESESVLTIEKNQDITFEYNNGQSVGAFNLDLYGINDTGNLLNHMIIGELENNEIINDQKSDGNYVNIVNNKITYTCDETLDGDKYISVQLSFSDPNSAIVKKSTDRINVKIKKYEIEWLFYISVDYSYADRTSSVKTKHFKYNEETFVPDISGLSDIYDAIPTWGDGTNGTVKKGLRYEENSSTVYQGGWSNVGTFNSVENKYAETNTKYIINGRTERVHADVNNNRYYQNDKYYTMLAIIPYDTIICDQLDTIAPPQIEFENIIINKGTYRVLYYNSTDTASAIWGFYIKHITND